MTKAAKAFGKLAPEFMRLPSTLEYLNALHGIFPGQGFSAVKLGRGSLPGVGTWAHPKLAVFFARWLDVRFAVWCDDAIDKILRGEMGVPSLR
jgi:hypothetical protein